MGKTAQKTDPKLWERVKSEVTRGGKGGDPGQWSARKAQLAVHEYKKRGGSYSGKKSNQNALTQWSDEDWGTKSGRNSRETGERYLPKKARKTLSGSDYRKTTAKKRADRSQGEPISRQPTDVTEKTARHRSTGKPLSKRAIQSKDELLQQARYLDIEGRSNMLKAELAEAVRLAKH
jgi:hypothetical protein